jgi:hypothetical protein
VRGPPGLRLSLPLGGAMYINNFGTNSWDTHKIKSTYVVQISSPTDCREICMHHNYKAWDRGRGMRTANLVNTRAGLVLGSVAERSGRREVTGRCGQGGVRCWKQARNKNTAEQIVVGNEGFKHPP